MRYHILWHLIWVCAVCKCPTKKTLDFYIQAIHFWIGNRILYSVSSLVCCDFSLFCHLLIFFKINFFEKKISGIPSDCQTVWIQIRPDRMSGLICVQLFAKVISRRHSVDKELIKKADVKSRKTLLPIMSVFPDTFLNFNACLNVFSVINITSFHTQIVLGQNLEDLHIFLPKISLKLAQWEKNLIAKFQNFLPRKFIFQQFGCQ